VQMPRHTLTTRTTQWGFIKLSMQNNAVRMKLSPCLSFYLEHSLSGYMVGTTLGFPCEIMEASPPQSHQRTP
jgi:hypothetical protein